MVEPKIGRDHDLPRRLGMQDATAIVIGIVIGSGIFLLPNLIARNLPSPAAILAAWIISGVLSFFGALAYAELGAMMPATGGQYVYLREAYGPMWAFVSGWTFMLAVLSGGSAWLAVTFSIYARYFLPLTPSMSKVMSIALITALSAVNYVGVREGAWVQRTFTYLKIAALLVLIGAAFLSPHSAHAAGASASPPVSLAHFGVAMAACLMAYNGWSYVNFVAGEVEDPQRNLLRSLAIGMAAVAVLYVLANVAYLKVMTIPQIASTERVGADLAMRTMGSVGGTFVSLTVLLSIVGAVNGCILTAARIPFAQARDRLFFASFGEVHPRFQTPARAILWGGIWTAILVLTGSYETLYTYSILAAWVFYTLSVGGRVRSAPQAAERCPALPHVGLSCHSVALRGGVDLVYGERVCDPSEAFINGLRNRCHRSLGLLDLAQTGAFVLAPGGQSSGRLTRDASLYRHRFGIRRILKSYVGYYACSRTHRALNKDAPEPRATAGRHRRVPPGVRASSSLRATSRLTIFSSLELQSLDRLG